jgi:hypothetical protein
VVKWLSTVRDYAQVSVVNPCTRILEINHFNECRWCNVHHKSYIKNLFLFYVFCTVHCDTVMQHKPTKCTLFRLIIFFKFWRFLRVSNLTGSSSGRQFVHAVFVWYVYTLWCQQCGRWKSVCVCAASCYTAFISACKHTVQTSVYNCLPEDGTARFEICKKVKNLIKI